MLLPLARFLWDVAAPSSMPMPTPQNITRTSQGTISMIGQTAQSLDCSILFTVKLVEQSPNVPETLGSLLYVKQQFYRQTAVDPVCADRLVTLVTT